MGRYWSETKGLRNTTYARSHWLVDWVWLGLVVCSPRTSWAWTILLDVRQKLVPFTRSFFCLCVLLSGPVCLLRAAVLSPETYYVRGHWMCWVINCHETIDCSGLFKEPLPPPVHYNQCIKGFSCDEIYCRETIDWPASSWNSLHSMMIYWAETLDSFGLFMERRLHENE